MPPKKFFYTSLFFVLAVSFLLTESVCDNVKVCSIFNLPMIEPYSSARIYFKAGYFFAITLSPISAVLCFYNMEVEKRKIYRDFVEKMPNSTRFLSFIFFVIFMALSPFLFSLGDINYRFSDYWLTEATKNRFFSAFVSSGFYMGFWGIWFGIVFEAVNFFNIFRKR